MCGRLVDPDLRSAGLDTSWLKIDPIPRRFNVKPTEQILIAAKQPLEGMYARWWLIPSWFDGPEAKDWKPTTFNARIEEAKTKPTFRSVWRHGRCLIPAAGFYEWSGPKDARQPHFITGAGNEPVIWLAGLASRWKGLLTCTVMTRAATQAMDGLHSRMPVILDTDERDAWLGGSDDLDLGIGAQLRHHPVPRFGLRDDGPELIEPV